MKRETFINYVENNNLIGTSSVNDLTYLVEEFPYCTTAHILLAMNLQKEDHFRYDAELKSAAIYAADRNVLRKHIERIRKSGEITVLPDEHREMDEEVVEETETLAQVVVEEEVVNEIEDPVKANPEEIAESDEPLTEVFDENTDKEESKVEETEPVKTHQPEQKHEEKKKPVKKKELENEDPLSQLKKIVTNRLKQIELDRQANEEVVKDVLPEETHEKVKPPKKKKQDKAITELIDNFIKTEPSITRRQTAFFDPIDASKDSVTDEENIVSETLADIYFDQRKFEKAIRLYKKLSLKFPEKSSYFAARIEKAVEELKK